MSLAARFDNVSVFRKRKRFKRNEKDKGPVSMGHEGSVAGDLFPKRSLKNSLRRGVGYKERVHEVL